MQPMDIRYAKVASPVALIYLGSPAVAPLSQGLGELQECQAALTAQGWRVIVLHNRGGASTLERALAEHNPRVLHFIGHADAKIGSSQARTLGLTDAAGELSLCSAKTLADLIAAHCLDLVFLNGCQSAGLARTVCAQGTCCIGWETDAHDLAASIFAAAVYAQLPPPVSIASLRNAFESGLRRVVDTLGQRRGGVANSHAAATRLPGGGVRLQFELAMPTQGIHKHNQRDQEKDPRAFALAGVPVLLLPQGL